MIKYTYQAPLKLHTKPYKTRNPREKNNGNYLKFIFA